MNDLPEHEVTIFNTARRLAGSERNAYLDEACAGDTALRGRLDDLLGVNEGEGDFLEKPALAASNAAAMSAGTIPPSLPLSEKPGDWIGPYKLLQQIGEGGCGVVYMAEQEAPIRRRVALKVIKLGMDTKQVIARFEAERQALALMDHPNIAKVLDAGTTETGRPYFVMELVHGIKITEFCDQDSLTTRQRLELFFQVCQAIQHAHQKGIIHRDIKPSNILVTVNDGIAVPKVIDFGIAKATQGRLTDETLFTAFGQFMGTPAYMSPEQAVLTGVDVDTRSDIYSLGVLLYELLTGQTPFDPKALLEAGLEEMRRTIHEQEPARPSTKLSTMEAGKLTMAAKRRSSEPPKLIHLVRGDLDWIVMKCLEKDRNRRYETANGLARDVERHLTDEPIVARPPGRLYRFQKLVRRNKVVFAAVGVVAVVLVLGVAVSTWQAIRATRAEREQTLLSHRAEAEAAKSQQVAGFFEDMLDGAGPLTALGRDTTVLREILDEANQKIGSDLAGQPEVEAEIRTKIGEIYLQIGEYAKAEAACRLALRIRESIFPATNEVVAEALHHLGTVLWREGKTGEAETIENQALERTRTAKGPASLSSAEVMYILGSVDEDKGEIAQGERMFRDALEIIQKLGKPEAKFQSRVDDDLFSLFNDLGMSQAARCDPIEAETNLSQALALAIKRFPTNDYRIASGYNNLANVQQQQESKLGLAETNQRQAVLICRTALPDTHPYLSFAKNNLGIILRRRWTLSGDSAQLRESLQLDPNEVLTQEAFASLMAKPDIVPVSSASSSWRFTTAPPAGDWTSPDFAEAGWKTTNFLCGSATYLNRLQRYPPTLISLTNLWLRQEFDLSELPRGKLVFRVNRNHDAQIFLNGVQAAPISDWRDTETLKPASEAGQLTLKRGRNVLAIHCQDADGGTPIGVSVCMSSDPSFGRNRLIEELSLLIESNTPPRWAFFAARGASYARLTQWKAAAEDMAKANDLRPPDALFWYQFAPVLVESGDLSGYESLRQRALKLSAGGGDPNSAARVARFTLLLPAPLAVLESAGKLADFAAADSVDFGVVVRQFAKGLADFRRGRFDSAIEWMRKTVATSTDSHLPAWTHERESNRCAAALFIEAMAYQQSNHPAEARAAFVQGLDLVKNQLASEISGDVGREWPEWINARLFMREAQALIEAPAK